MRAKKISVIIPYYNGNDVIERCIEELYTRKNRSEPEVIVASDGYEDRDILYALKKKYGFKLIFGERVGFGRNCNRAFEHTRGDIVVFLNQDVFVLDEWDEPILSILEDQTVGAVGAKLIYPDGKIQHCGVAFSPFLDSVHIYRMYPRNFPPSEKQREFQAVTGALLGIRREIFEKVKFSEDYILYYEDTDLCFTLRRKGMKITYSPHIKAIHLESTSVSKKVADENIRRSKDIFLKKWKAHIVPDELTTYIKDRQLILFLIKSIKYLKKGLRLSLS